MNLMNCDTVRPLLPGYLDGALPVRAPSETHVLIARHLDRCEECRSELQAYLKLSSWMANTERPTAPPLLSVEIRVKIAQRLARTSWLHYVRRGRTRAQLLFQNFLQPLAVAATGGLSVALAVFILVCQLLGMGVPLRAVTNDSPTNLLQPARLEALAPFPITGMEESGRSGSHGLLVETVVNAQGQAVTYEILAGPDTIAIRHQLDQVLLFSRFRPQMSFGRPTSGGRVVLSFSTISVRG